MKILAALSRFPWPLEKGDKLRAYYQLKGLAENHDVHLVCLDDSPIPIEFLSKLSFCKSVNVIHHSRIKAATNVAKGAFNQMPFQVNYFHSPEMKKVLKSIIRKEKIDICFVQLIRLGMNIPFEEKTAFFLDYMDAFSIGMKKRAQQGNPLSRLAAKKEYNRLVRYESELGKFFDGYSIISERDAEALSESIRLNVRILPNGVNEDFFEPFSLPENQSYDLIFFGNMGYHPNVVSAKYLVSEVLPEVKKRGRNIRLCIAGARPAPAVRALAGDHISVTGFVEDIRVEIVRSKLAIAPLISGQGLQNKLLESMAMGVPTLTTPVASSALNGEHAEALVVCHSTEEFAEKIIYLLDNEEVAKKIGANGRKYVEENYRWDKMNLRLEQLLEECIENKS